ncbi:hypothetical protein [Corynebacterium sp.]|uniref:hypothetical protein n=1 Tax=Corynebacterium sp. TaxID=1720 RepID=UPI0034CE51DD
MAAAEDRVWGHIPHKTQIRRWLQDLCGRLGELGREAQLELDHRSTVPELMGRMQRQMHNVVRIDAPSVAAGRSVAEVADLMFALRISAEPGEKPQAGTRAVRRSMLQEYRGREHLRAALHIRPQLILGGRVSRLDAAVVDDSVLEINRAFSFAVTPSSEVEDRTDAWTYRVEQLRRSGGTLISTQGQQWELGSDTPVCTVFEAPKSTEQRELFKQATSDWEELDIHMINVADIAAHADGLDLDLSKSA